ncbi:MAG: AlbA family DNA-binding domain-containing protein [Halobacteriota archaeon]
MDDLIDIFLKSPNCDTLKGLLHGHTGENGWRRRLDFKQQMPPMCVKLAKTMLAIANCGGGVIILGVCQNKDGTFHYKGLPAFVDKSKIIVDQYLPDSLKLLYNVVNLECPNGVNNTIKKYQAILIKDDPLVLPHFAEVDKGSIICEGNVYVRRGTRAEKANAVEFTHIMNRRLAALTQQAQKEQDSEVASYRGISATEKAILRKLLYEEIITVAEKIELVQFGACYAMNSESGDNYILSDRKLEHIAPIRFPQRESLDWILYGQLEDKKDIEDIYEDLQMDKNGLVTFSETPFDSEKKAKRLISELRQRFSEQTANRIDRLLEGSSPFLQQLDNLPDLKKRWYKVKNALSNRFRCAADMETFDKITNSAREKRDAVRRKRERRQQFLKSVYDCLDRNNTKAICITRDPMQYPLIKDYGFSVDEIGEFVDYYKGKGCIVAKPTWGTKIPLELVMTGLGTEYVESLLLQGG